MLRSGETKITKQTLFSEKKPKNVWDVSVNNMVVSK